MGAPAAGVLGRGVNYDMTTRDSALLWNPLSEAESQPTITPVQWILHTAVDAPGPTNLRGYFENHTSLESHTWLRWDRHEQLMSFGRRADANYKANRWFNTTLRRYEGAISTETEDDGDPVGKPWNAYQIGELVRFGVWLNRTYGIPAVIPATPYSPGMGYHSLFPGVWSNVVGKTCPGSTRIRQFRDIVLPRIQAIVNGPVRVPPNTQELFTVGQYEEIMAAIEKAQLHAIDAANRAKDAEAGVKLLLAETMPIATQREQARNVKRAALAAGAVGVEGVTDDVRQP